MTMTGPLLITGSLLILALNTIGVRYINRPWRNGITVVIAALMFGYAAVASIPSVPLPA